MAARKSRSRIHKSWPESEAWHHLTRDQKNAYTRWRHERDGEKIYHWWIIEQGNYAAAVDGKHYIAVALRSFRADAKQLASEQFVGLMKEQIRTILTRGKSGRPLAPVAGLRKNRPTIEFESRMINRGEEVASRLGSRLVATIANALRRKVSEHSTSRTEDLWYSVPIIVTRVPKNDEYAWKVQIDPNHTVLVNPAHGSGTGLGLIKEFLREWRASNPRRKKKRRKASKRKSSSTSANKYFYTEKDAIKDALERYDSFVKTLKRQPQTPKERKALGEISGAVSALRFRQLPQMTQRIIIGSFESEAQTILRTIQETSGRTGRYPKGSPFSRAKSGSGMPSPGRMFQKGSSLGATMTGSDGWLRTKTIGAGDDKREFGIWQTRTRSEKFTGSKALSHLEEPWMKETKFTLSVKREIRSHKYEKKQLVSQTYFSSADERSVVIDPEGRKFIYTYKVKSKMVPHRFKMVRGKKAKTYTREVSVELRRVQLDFSPFGNIVPTITPIFDMNKVFRWNPKKFSLASLYYTGEPMSIPDYLKKQYRPAIIMAQISKQPTSRVFSTGRVMSGKTYQRKRYSTAYFIHQLYRGIDDFNDQR